MRMTDVYKKQAQEDIVGQSIEVVRKRIDELGTREPTIERQGDDRIVVQVPGLSDPKRLIDILKTTAKMTFQLVDETADIEQAIKGDRLPIGSRLLQSRQEKSGRRASAVRHAEARVRRRRQADRCEGRLRSAHPAVCVVVSSLRLRRRAKIRRRDPREYPQPFHRFAIVLDKLVLTSPKPSESRS